MSILETQIIDIVATKPGTDEVRLMISDDLDWADPEAHKRHLQDKINTYIAFVESGQLGRTTDPPVPAIPRVTIAVATAEAPPDVAKTFLGQVETFLAGVGLGFVVEVRGESEG